MSAAIPFLVEARHLVMHYARAATAPGRHLDRIKAVDDVSFAIKPGEAFGLVGESGSGKSTVGRLLIALLQPTSGQVLFDGQDLARLSTAELRRARRQFQILFQDPYSTLNPRHTVAQILARPLEIHRLGNARTIRARARALLNLVGLPDHYLLRLPNALSGGERQRVAIARALTLEPRFLVLDEPTSALDVSVQAQVIDLLMELKAQLKLSYLFISHNLSLVEYVCDRTLVLYAGRAAELGQSSDLHRAPLHPYTQALLSSVLEPTAAPLGTEPIAGDMPAPWNLPTGCRFHPRCPVAFDLCARVEPVWIEVEPGRVAACHKLQAENADAR